MEDIIPIAVCIIVVGFIIKHIYDVRRKTPLIRVKYPRMMAYVPISQRNILATYSYKPYRFIELENQSVEIKLVTDCRFEDKEIVVLTSDGVPICNIPYDYREPLIDFVQNIDWANVSNIETDRKGEDMFLTLEIFFKEEACDAKEVTLKDNYVTEFEKNDTYTFHEEIIAENNYTGDFWIEQAEKRKFHKQLKQ